MINSLLNSFECTEGLIEDDAVRDHLSPKPLIDAIVQLFEKQENEGVETFSLDVLLKAVAVIGWHARTHGSRPFEGLDEQILHRVETSVDQVLPVLLALSDSQCISVIRTEKSTWVFCLKPTLSTQ